jgi:hypothetical protein
MTSLIQNIASKIILLSAVCAIGGFFTAQPALADHSKKTSDGSKQSSSALKYTTPGVSAAEAIVTVLGRQVGTSNRSAKTRLSNDTSSRESRIVSVRATADVLTVVIDVAADEPNLDIGIYNMLGKKMVDVYRGPATKGEKEYKASISDLPEGVYICILQASSTRRAEKFYLSR